LPATARQRGVFTSDIPLPNEPVAAIAPPVVENHSLRYVRRLAWRGGVLVVLVLAYVSITAGLLPPDMGKGPTAEMRYIVPLLPIGATLAGLALVVLWYRWRPAAPLAALLLLTTNWLYFGFAAQRFDGTSAGWPPTLYRYGVELCNPYETGNRAMVDLLRQLPAGTRVRIWPPFMTYPPMFYVPQLHYCDQLTVKKHIRKDLLAQLPDYLFVERARPDVIFVPAPYLRAAMEEVERRYGRDAYRIVKTLRPYWSYTTKPEIPTHFFWRAEGSWLEYPGMAILLAAGSPLEKEAALAGSATDADSVCNLGQSLLIAQKPELAEICFREALRINPTDAVAHCEWGNLLLVEGKAIRAEEHFRASLRRDSRCVDALVGLGAALESLGRKDEAARQQRAALELRPHWPPAHYNLAKVLAEQGELDRAVDHYLAALDADPNYTYAHVNLGVLLLQSGSVNEAIEHFRAAVRLQPELIEGHVNLGRALASSGQYEAAAAEFHVALSLLPAHSPLLEKVRAMLRKVE
jgi:tetratricopeptide (TPR) repeat protein